MVVKSEDSSIKLVEDGAVIKRRQDAPVCFDLATVAYVAHCSYVLESSGLWVGKVHGVQVPAEYAVDIDTHLDYAMAKFLIEDYFPRGQEN
jgi:N-acylneuraminate cytidylyltransferase